MPVPIRTLTRAFLLVGGGAYAVSAALDGATLKMAFGLFAAALGGFGLLWTYRESRTAE
jgi:hypothetical protein